MTSKSLSTLHEVQVLRSIAFLHSLDLIHSDLKPENILVKSYSRSATLRSPYLLDLFIVCIEQHDNSVSKLSGGSRHIGQVDPGRPGGGGCRPAEGGGGEHGLRLRQQTLGSKHKLQRLRAYYERVTTVTFSRIYVGVSAFGVSYFMCMPGLVLWYYTTPAQPLSSNTAHLLCDCNSITEDATQLAYVCWADNIFRGSYVSMMLCHMCCFVTCHTDRVQHQSLNNHLSKPAMPAVRYSLSEAVRSPCPSSSIIFQMLLSGRGCTRGTCMIVVSC